MHFMKHESGTNAIEFDQFSLLTLKFMSGIPNFERKLEQRNSSILIRKEREIHELQPQPG